MRAVRGVSLDVSDGEYLAYHKRQRGKSAVDALPEHAIEVKRGSVVLHHALTVHHSQPNQSNRSRRGLVYVYMSPKVKLVQPERMQGPAVFPEVE